MKILVACLIVAFAISMVYACSSCSHSHSHKNWHPSIGLRSKWFHGGSGGYCNRRHGSGGWGGCGGWGGWKGDDDFGRWGHDDWNYRRPNFNFRVPKCWGGHDRHHDSCCERRPWW